MLSDGDFSLQASYFSVGFIAIGSELVSFTFEFK
jgi:hypothetical protein